MTFDKLNIFEHLSMFEGYWNRNCLLIIEKNIEQNQFFYGVINKRSITKDKYRSRLVSFYN